MTIEEQQLLDQIRKAFADIRLEDGTSLNMTEYYDSGGSKPGFAEKAKFDERNDWSSIEDHTLEQFTVTFSFTDLKGFRFYLPAYMTWTIRNHSLSDSIISDSTIYAIDPNHYLFKDVPFVDWFSKEQIAAIVRFLEYAIQNEDSLDGDVARINLSRIREAQKSIEQ